MGKKYLRPQAHFEAVQTPSRGDKSDVLSFVFLSAPASSCRRPLGKILHLFVGLL